MFTFSKYTHQNSDSTAYFIKTNTNLLCGMCNAKYFTVQHHICKHCRSQFVNALLTQSKYANSINVNNILHTGTAGRTKFMYAVHVFVKN